MLRVGLALSIVAPLAGCAELIGAEFDVDPLPGGGGAGGSSNTVCPDGSLELARGLSSPWGIAIGNETVVWTEAGSGKVQRTKRDGSEPTVLVHDLMESPNRIVADSSHAYWTETGTAETGSGRVWRAPLAGGPAEVLADGLDAPFGIVVDFGVVYYTTRLGGEDGFHDVYRIDTNTAPMTPILTVQAPPNPLFLARGPGVLYGTSEAVPSYVWSHADGDPPEQVTALQVTFEPAVIQRYDDRLLVGSLTDSRLMILDTALTQASLMVDAVPQMADVLVRGGFVYYASFGGGYVDRLTLPVGGTPERFVAGARSPNGLAADELGVYFTLHFEGGAVCRKDVVP